MIITEYLELLLDTQTASRKSKAWQISPSVLIWIESRRATDRLLVTAAGVSLQGSASFGLALLDPEAGVEE